MASISPVPAVALSDDPGQDAIWKRWFSVLHKLVGRLYTASGDTGVIATATPTTMFSISIAGLYLVAAWVTDAASSSLQAWAVVECSGDITAGQIHSTDGSAMALTLTGAGAVQVEQTSGSDQTVQFAYLRLTA